NDLQVDDLGAHLTALRRLGVPYTDEMIANASRDALAQARPDSDDAAGVTARYGEATTVRQFSKSDSLTEMDALVAYLQGLGQQTQAPYAKGAMP
ncbi:MAG: cbb3-type cytochrome c oxidase subunit II, partial [Cypionkella sp.]